MKLRYKKTLTETGGSSFNMHALAEVLTGDDSASIAELDVWLEKTTPPQWKDMGQAFRDKDLITDDLNSRFFEPENEEDRERGYAL